MFRVEFFVDDKRLGTALLALVGLANGQPSVFPVANIQKKGNGVAAISNGSAAERFAAQLRKMKLTQFAASEVPAEVMKSVGMSPSSKTYLLKQTVKAGFIRKSGTGSGTTYKVV